MALTTLNTAPIFSGAPAYTAIVIATATATVSGNSPGTIGTNSFLAFSAGSSGSFIQKIKFVYSSTTSAIASVNTILRVFVSTVNTGAPTASQAWLLAEVAAPAQTVSTVIPSYVIEVPINLAIPSSTYLLVTQTVAQSANSQWQAITFGGNY